MRDVWSSIPYAMVSAVFAKAGSNGSALLLNNGSFIGDRLGRAHVADELLD